MTGEVGAVSAGLPTAQRPWDSAPDFVDCPIRGRGQVRVGQRSSLVGPLSEGFLEKGKQGRSRVVETKQRPGKPGFSNSPQHPRKAVETAALWKPWKNSDLAKTTPGGEFFHRSHSAWKTPPDGVSHSSHRFCGWISNKQTHSAPLRGEGFNRD